jgi:hypothetical protein
VPGVRVGAVIREYYPRAWQHLYKKMAMAPLWSTLFRGGLLEESVLTSSDGPGVVSARLAWFLA